MSWQVEPQKKWGQVALRFETQNGQFSQKELEKGLESLPHIFENVGVRRIRLPLAPGVLEALESYKGFRVVLEVSPETLDLLEKDFPQKWEYEDRNLWVTPSHNTSDAMLQVIREASLKGWPVVLEPDPWVIRGDKEFLFSALEHYLFTEELVVPVEPFHSLLRALVQKLDNRDLWTIWTGPPLDAFFMDAQGKVSLCPQWIEEGRLYGDSSQSVEQWRNSKAYKRLEDKLANHPEKGTLCEKCPHNKICGGVLLNFREDAACETWMEVFERVVLASISLKGTMMRRRGGKRKKGRGEKGIEEGLSRNQANVLRKARRGRQMRQKGQGAQKTGGAKGGGQTAEKAKKE